ncbi:signal transduction histidine kinase [Variovorax sp. SG517]|uniref:hybrid sensor histidine kinase/response regulator n=1 Tax=Variovorax sp. SG517 TaxID=2587117 RepID=UPI00159E9BDE|nr:hybrid sensor histidine kinase/response regulator [Variovorax sp. SG517]NVM86608.1 signal transduction histidine kinase [Variovorax sp. SG517]
MPSAPDELDELDERRLQVVAEQAVGLRWQILLTAAVVAAIVWRDLPAPWVLGWFAAVIASREWRAAALARMAADRTRPIAARLRATVRWNVLIGACNGSAALFMARLDPTLDAVLTMILVSWGAGAVSTSATVMPAFLAYAGLLFVPTAAMWLMAGGWLGWGVGALVLMFFGVQTRFARRNLQTFEESFGIRAENQALATSLEFERTQLAIARDEAVRANNDKSRFLAGASHDLRQPLQAMALNVGALRHVAMAPDARAIVEVVDSSLEQLRAMLDALLDVSKLDAGVVVAQPQRVRVDRLLTAVAASFGAAAAARRVGLHTDCPPGLAVRTDPDLLRRMLANLIDNAIKFSPADGQVEVRARVRDAAADASNAEVELTVRDSGPGIAPENHRIVFEDLVQLHAAGPGAPAAAGHGLGLGIVRRVAELLGVPVELESSLGAGACFRLRLPLAAPPGAEGAEGDGADAPWSLDGRCVLVLEDDPMVRGAYLNALGAMGCRVLAASTLDEALQQIDEPDALVLDCRLGGVSGFDAAERLRGQRCARPALPVVMVTADTGPAVIEAARRQALPLLRKPVDDRTLGRALAAAIERS